MQQTYSYLALGDSYTIGESVEIIYSFPYQTIQILRKQNHNFLAPEIIAKTGWTSDELQASMNGYQFLPKYDFVSLLIGVNNQYRGRDVIEFKTQFEELLRRAIELAHGKKEHVIVLSIPDYSVTPYARDLDREKIEKEIEVYNSISKAVSIQYKVHYIDITPGTREVLEKPDLLAADGLHPSANEYARWAEKLAAIIVSQLKK